MRRPATVALGTSSLFAIVLTLLQDPNVAGQQQTRTRGSSVKVPGDPPCELVIFSTVSDTPENVKQADADVNTVAQALNDAFQQSKDMRAKVRTACQKWGRKLNIRVTRNDPGIDSAEWATFVDQQGREVAGEMRLDLGDMAVMLGSNFFTGSPAPLTVLHSSELVRSLAHEFDHARDGPNQHQHEDPSDAECIADANNSGSAVADENLVSAQMGLGVERQQYLLRQDDKWKVTYTVTYQQGDQTFKGDVTFNVTDFSNWRRLVETAAAGATPPSQAPQSAGPPMPPQGPQQAGPPMPPQGPQPSGPPGPRQERRRHYFRVDETPGTPCVGQTGGSCYPLPLATDADLDGVPDSRDNCPKFVNPQQADANGNGIGDDCEPGFRSCTPPPAPTTLLSGGGGNDRLTTVMPAAPPVEPLSLSGGGGNDALDVAGTFDALDDGQDGNGKVKQQTVPVTRTASKEEARRLPFTWRQVAEALGSWMGSPASRAGRIRVAGSSNAPATLRLADLVDQRRPNTPGSPAFQMLVVGLGVSTGDAFRAYFVNEGPRPVRLEDDDLVFEPVKASQKEVSRLAQQFTARNAVSTVLTGYCLEFLKPVAAAGTLFRLASPERHRQLAPLRDVLRAGDRLEQAGALSPDTKAASYFLSIKQWALWVREQRMTMEGYRRALIEYTKKNVSNAGQRWTGEMEAVIDKLVPHRWQEIQKILREAERPAP